MMLSNFKINDFTETDLVPKVEFEKIDGIVFGTFNLENITLEIAKLSVQKRLKFTNQKNCIMLIDVTKVKVICKDSRNFFASKEGTQLVIAAAMYTNSYVSVFLVNFFLKINLKNDKVPVKLFISREKAILWLQKYK